MTKERVVSCPTHEVVSGICSLTRLVKALELVRGARLAHHRQSGLPTKSRSGFGSLADNRQPVSQPVSNESVTDGWATNQK